MGSRYGFVSARALAVTLSVLGLSACANASLGLDDEAVSVHLDRVVWQDSAADGYHGVISLIADEPDASDVDGLWQLHLRVPDGVFGERRPFDMGRMPHGHRIYLMSPSHIEYRGVAGPVVLSRRGGGSLDGVFALPGDSPSLDLTLTWTSWHVSDRRLLNGNTEDQSAPTNFAE